MLELKCSWRRQGLEDPARRSSERRRTGWGGSGAGGGSSDAVARRGPLAADLGELEPQQSLLAVFIAQVSPSFDLSLHPDFFP